jgi:hypothetical protein
MKSYLIAALVLLTNTLSQDFSPMRCGNEQLPPPKELLDYKNQIANVDGSSDEAAIAAAPQQPIKVYYHVIGSTTEEALAVTPAIITNQTRILNQVYLGTGFQFTHINTSYAVNPTWAYARGGEYEMKSNRSGTYRDLNLYFLSHFRDNDGKSFGYCKYPVNLTKTPPEQRNRVFTLDGCIIDSRVMPNRKIFPQYDPGKIAAHEVGHWLGLFHPWGNSDTGIGRCIDDDAVSDTPLQWGPSNMTKADECPPLNKSSCSNPGYNNADNHMDYTDDKCRTRFTPGQIARMNQLWDLRKTA